MTHVSIHAPARGATGYLSQRGSLLPRFNPRTREGCDHGFRCMGTRLVSFNPRTREGCDPDGDECRQVIGGFQSTHPRGVRQTIISTVTQIIGVSIHAPARGATYGRLVIGLLRWCFNPRTREGCDGPSMGVALGASRFNPRTREGCDHIGDLTMRRL